MLFTERFFFSIVNNETFLYSLSGKSLEFGRETICIDIKYPNENSAKKYDYGIDKNKIFEIVSDRNHTIRYDTENGNAYMKNVNGQYIKMDRQMLGEKFYSYKNSILTVIVPCKRYLHKRKFLILTDIVTNKPRRERNSRTL